MRIEEFGIKCLGINDSGRRLFDSLVYTPAGTTYNSYLIKGELFTALIDCSDYATRDQYMAQFDMNDIESIDYIVALHSEQDHSGLVTDVLARFPEAKVACTEKVKQLCDVHLHLSDERMLIFKEGDTLDLGGMSLTFYPIPFAHWPDNTMVHLEPQNILFSSDLFGAHFTGTAEASELSESHIKYARNYFSEIMMPFRKNIVKYIALAEKLNPLIIAPAHGAIYNEPKRILDLYKDWTSDRVISKVSIPFISMHDSIRTAVEILAEELRILGIEVILRDLGAHPDSLLIETGELIYDMVDSAAIIFAFPTVLGGPHPAIAYAAITSNAMMPKTKFVGTICSYAWATKATETVTAVTPNFKGVRFEPVLFKGLPTEADKDMLRSYANMVADSIFRECNKS